MLLVIGLATGCVTTKQGEEIGREEVKRDRVGTTQYSFDVASYNVDQVTARIRVMQVPEYEVEYVKTYQRIRDPNATFSGAMSLASLAVAGVGLGLRPTCAVREATNCVTPEDKAAEREASIVAGAGLAGALLFGLIWSHRSDKGPEPDGEIKGEPFQKRESGSSQPVAQEQVIVSVEGRNQGRYRTDDNGYITVGLADELGLTYFDQIRPKTLAVTLPDREHVSYLPVDPEQWTVPYIRFVREGTKLYAGPVYTDVLSATVPEDVGAEQKVQAERRGWLQIQMSGRSYWVRADEVGRFWAVPTRVDPSRLPSLAVDVEFEEPSGNGKLDADETAQLRVRLTNAGEGPAYRARSSLSLQEGKGLQAPEIKSIGTLAPGEEKEMIFPIEAVRAVGSGERMATLRFREANGFEPAQVQVVFETRAFVPPELEVADVGIEDASGNGQIEPGELVRVTARIRNASKGRACEVTAQVNLGDNVFEGPDFSAAHEIGALGPGEFEDIAFSLYTNNRASSVPVTVDLRESYGEFGRSGVELPLPFNTTIGQITQVRVEGRDTQVQGVSGGLNVDIWEDLPETEMDRPDAVAVVVGIRDYQNPQVPSVEYAKRDATIMRRYLTEVLGFREENILPRDPNRPMTAGALKTLIRQQLPGYLREGSDVFVYFSGHGAPSTGAAPNAYLVPADANPNFVSDDNAYRLEYFYEDLTRVAEAQNVNALTVVLDACFSGQGRRGDVLVRQASNLTLSVESPLLAKENAVSFAASGPAQVANWYPEKKHGMFTYFFLKGLKGAADLDGNAQVTIGEMREYLTDNEEGVPYWSRRIHQRPQVPQVQTGNRNAVLVNLSKK